MFEVQYSTHAFFLVRVAIRRGLVTFAGRLVHSCIIMNGNGSAHVIRDSCECSSQSVDTDVWSVASVYSNGRARVAADVTGASLFQMTFKALGLKGHPTSAVQRVKIHQSTLPGYRCTAVTMELTNTARLSSHQSLKLVTGLVLAIFNTKTLSILLTQCMYVFYEKNIYEPYSKKMENDHIQHKNKSNGNVGEPHTEGENCDKRQYY